MTRRCDDAHVPLPPPRARPASFRPALEVLEDRCLLAAAALDPTFNGNGKQTLGFAGGSVTATAVAVKVGFGKIIVAGDLQPTGSTAAGTFALARFNPDGSFDTAFGSGGRVTIDFGPLGRNAQATAVYQQIDDKIVVGGSVVTPTGSHDFAIARLTAAGALDGSFGTGGKQTIDFGFDDFLTGLAIQQFDQKIVVAGHGNSTGAAVFEVARLGTNGSLDASFGSGGKEIVPVGTVGVANAVALQGDGKIVLAGATGPSGGPDNFAAVRLTAAGVPDTSFGSGGVQTVSFGADARANALTFQPGDNKIVLAGFTTVSTSLGATPVMAATRLNTNGTLDTSFGTGGKVNTAAVYFGSLSQQRSSTANGVGVDLANKILLVGSWGRPNDPTRGAFDILRLNADGSLDQNFNPAFAGPQAAEFTVGFGDNSVSQGNAVVLYGPDQLVVVGSTAPVVPGTPPTVGASSFAVARLNQLSMGPSSTAGMFDPSTGTWYLKNSNSAGAPDFAPFRYGAPGWVPLVGDWNADRAATVGVFDPATATWYLKNSNSPGAPDIAPFAYGAPGWIPVLGSLGDPGMPRYGIPPHGAAVGVVDPSTMTWYLKNSNTPGAPDIAPFRYGQPGDIPVVGNWLGGFSTGIGVFRPSNATGICATAAAPAPRTSPRSPTAPAT